MTLTDASSMHVYDRAYYEYINVGSIRSAEALLPTVARHFTVRSVADFGAGQGAWLSVWRRLGVSDIRALDGSYVNQAALLVPGETFVPVDLARRVRLGRTFDLVQSLEVAEHLPSSAAEQFVDNLVAHSSLVLFSAAVPGQGGEYHVNEQPYSYWRGLFAARDYVMLDIIRPSLAGDTHIEPWYRYNTFVYVHRDHLAAMPAAIQRLQVRSDERIPDVAPARYRLRRMIIRTLPVWAVTELAVLKKQYYTRLQPNARSR
jgi:hypothetical protein